MPYCIINDNICWNNQLPLNTVTEFFWKLPFLVQWKITLFLSFLHASSCPFEQMRCTLMMIFSCLFSGSMTDQTALFLFPFLLQFSSFFLNIYIFSSGCFLGVGFDESCFSCCWTFLRLERYLVVLVLQQKRWPWADVRLLVTRALL